MPALTTIAIGAAVAGTAISAYGNYKANVAQAQAERANAAFYEEQAQFAREAGKRQLEIFEDESEQFIGRQLSQAGAGGVTQSGSALLAFGDSKLRQLRERGAIQMDTNAKVREAMLKAGASREQAERITSWENMFLPTAGSALTTAAQVGTSIARK